jgi:hypothetical protein
LPCGFRIDIARGLVIDTDSRIHSLFNLLVA